MTFALFFSAFFGFIVGAFQMRSLLTHTPNTAKWPWQKKGYALYNFYLQQKWDLFGICLCVELLKPSILYGLFLIVAGDTSLAEAIAIGTASGQLLSLNTKKQTKLSVLPILSVLIALTPLIGILTCVLYACVFHWKNNKATAAIITTFSAIVFILLTHIQEGYSGYIIAIASVMLVLWSRDIASTTSWKKH
jgi:hypothetical protein